MTECRVTYGLEAQTFLAPPGTRLLDAILRFHPDHRHLCGGRGFCTSCRVRVDSGQLSKPSAVERERLGARCGELRLACQCYLAGDVTIIPAVTASLIDWN